VGRLEHLNFMPTGEPNFILYAQHGWADNHQAIAALAKSVATEGTKIIAPDLGYARTWLRIETLIQTVETVATETIAKYPGVPIRIIGHSMGGLVWLEVLNRHPEWWSLIDSLVLVASPVGGADLARIFDPLGLGIGIAKDLGADRRAIAEKIAATIPTLAIVGDVDGGSDGTITVGTARFRFAQVVYLPGLSHEALRNHPSVAAAISRFWEQREALPDLDPEVDRLIQQLQAVPGMTDAHQRDFYKATVFLECKNGVTIRVWKNPMGIDHVFVVCPKGQCLYGGFVGWIHAKDLQRVLERIKQDGCTTPEQNTV